MPPTSPVVLPLRKVALAALRGILLGTASYALALLVEDRRRRINLARRLVENKKKIRESPLYRPGGSDALIAAAIDAAAVIESAPDSGASVPWSYPRAPSRRGSVQLRQTAGADGATGARRHHPSRGGCLEPQDGEDVPRKRRKTDDGAPDKLSVASGPGASPSPDAASVPTTPTGATSLFHSMSAPGWQPPPGRRGISPSTQRRHMWTAAAARPPEPVSIPDLSSPVARGVFGPVTAPQPTRYEDDLAHSLNEADQPQIPAHNRALGSIAFPRNEEIIQMVDAACEENKSHSLRRAVRLVHDAIQYQVASDNLDDAWMEASARLCRTLQDMGQLDDAAELLRLMIERGPMDEATYLAHRPIELINALSSRLQAVRPPPSGTEDDAESRSERLAQLEANRRLFRLLVPLFLPIFLSRPSPNAHVHDTGKRLLELAISVHHNPDMLLDTRHAAAHDQIKWIEKLFWRCVSAREEPDCELTAWLISSLQDRSEHKTAIKFFLACFTKMSPEGTTLYSATNAAVKAVQRTGGFKAAQVLKAMVSLFSGQWKLPPEWVISVVDTHWRRHLDWKATEDLYHDLLAMGLRDALMREEDLCRIMITVSLEAGKKGAADSYFGHLLGIMPQLAGDPKVFGAYALYYAKGNDWEGTQHAFESMISNGEKDEEARGRAFVPVMQLYLEQHTLAETETFLRFYAGKLRVRIHRYLVPLLANVYGQSRDTSAFVRWLDFCSRVPTIVANEKPGFGNAILVNCRRKWRFPFRDLRTVYRKLQVLDPTFVDHFSEQLMAKAALDDSRHDGVAARGRLLSLRIHEPDRLLAPALGRVAPDTAASLSMKIALAAGRPGAALRTYRSVLEKRSFVPTRQLLQLALWADQMQNKRRISSTTVGLLRDTEERIRGRPATPGQLRRQRLMPSWIMSLRARLELDVIKPKIGGIAVEHAVERILQQYAERGLSHDDELLNKAADTCLHAGNYPATVKYAIKAARVAEKAYTTIRQLGFPAASTLAGTSSIDEHPSAVADQSSGKVGTGTDTDAADEPWLAAAAALVAANGAGPCYSLRNFLILVSAYIGLGSAQLVRLATSRAAQSNYAGSPLCRGVLRTGLRRARATAATRGRGPDQQPCWPARVWGGAPEMQGTAGTTAAEISAEGWRDTRTAIRQAMEVLGRARAHAREEGIRQSDAAIDFMRRLAREAGRPEVDFGAIPWLGGEWVEQHEGGGEATEWLEERASLLLSEDLGGDGIGDEAGMEAIEFRCGQESGAQVSTGLDQELSMDGVVEHRNTLAPRS